jgi:SP family general alpha glucoside:H+ symporter-like MFS transporter
MTTEKIIPTDRELHNIELNNPDVIELTRQAEESDAADRLLTIRQALIKYKKAVFWAMFLSTSLIMEGYDLVIVSISSYSPKRVPC